MTDCGTHCLAVVAAFNAQETIEKTIQSIHAQYHANLHIVVCDDASTDQTPEILNRLERSIENLHIVYRQENAGFPSVPRNQAIAYAIEHNVPFDYIAFCDSDDFWLPGKLDRQLKVFSGNPGVGLVYSSQFYVQRENDRELIVRRQVQSLREFLYFNHISCSSVILKRGLVETFLPLFDENPLLKATEDTECWCRLMASNIKVGSTATPDFVYSQSEDSISAVENRLVRKRLRYLYNNIREKNNLSYLSVWPPLMLKLLRYLW